jgi:hypothetical protein
MWRQYRTNVPLCQEVVTKGDVCHDVSRFTVLLLEGVIGIGR